MKKMLVVVLSAMFVMFGSFALFAANYNATFEFITDAGVNPTFGVWVNGNGNNENYNEWLVDKNPAWVTSTTLSDSGNYYIDIVPGGNPPSETTYGIMYYDTSGGSNPVLAWADMQDGLNEWLGYITNGCSYNIEGGYTAHFSCNSAQTHWTVTIT